MSFRRYSPRVAVIQLDGVVSSMLARCSEAHPEEALQTVATSVLRYWRCWQLPHSDVDSVLSALLAIVPEWAPDPSMDAAPVSCYVVRN